MTPPYRRGKSSENQKYQDSLELFQTIYLEFETVKCCSDEEIESLRKEVRRLRNKLENAKNTIKQLEENSNKIDKNNEDIDSLT
ncbi:6494_t:CDS:2, partial [Racocetra persica]